MKRPVLHIIQAILIFFLLYLAIHEGSVGAERVFIFIVWFDFISSFSLLAPPIAPQAEILKKKGYPIPAPIFHLLGAALIFACVWNGWWITGIVLLLNEIAQRAIYGEDASEK
jgi:hypothetical protein